MTAKNLKLGEYIKEKRTELGYSIREVERKTKISNAYLGQIERGEVSEPSPSKLMKLSECLDLSYKRLMELAGYVMPSDKSENNRVSNTQTMLLSDEDMTEEEAMALREFLKTIRTFSKK